MPKISLIIPCYNEREVLPIFYKAVTDVLGKMKVDYELLFVDDGSKDDTLIVLRNFADANQNVHYISFSRNFGKEAAMYAGFQNVKGDYVAVMDADMQDPPALLPQMLSLLESGDYDSVATRRVTRKGEPKIRSWFARRFYQLMDKISDADIVDGARDFRLMTKRMADTIAAMPEYSRFSKGIFGWVGFRTYWMEYENKERAAGTTKWNFFKLFKYAISGIVSFSWVPLTAPFWLGSFCMLIAILGFVLELFNHPVFPEKFSEISLFMNGLQFLCIGTIGRYLAEVCKETKRRPHYIIAEKKLKDDPQIIA